MNHLLLLSMHRSRNSSKIIKNCNGYSRIKRSGPILLKGNLDCEKIQIPIVRRVSLGWKITSPRPSRSSRMKNVQWRSSKRLSLRRSVGRLLEKAKLATIQTALSKRQHSTRAITKTYSSMKKIRIGICRKSS